MSTGWFIVILVLVMGIIVGNILLLKYSTKFNIPKNFKKRPDSDYDDDKDKRDDW